MSKRRIDTADTVEHALHTLHHLQTEGWAVANVTTHFDYASPSDRHRQIPVEAVITIRLAPTR